MEMRFSREFVTLAETCNYLKASEILYMSQSTLSRHIQMLEQSLGAELFSRTTRSVSLTELGQLYCEYARRAVCLEEECSEAVYQHMQRGEDSVVLGMIPLAAKYGFQAVGNLHIDHPEYRIKTALNDSATLKSMLLGGSCDFALVREFASEGVDDDFCRVKFYEDNLQLIASVEHPLASRSSVSLIELRDENFLLPPEGIENYIDCVNACRYAGFEPKIGSTVTPRETLLDMVGMNLGITVLPKIRTDTISPKRMVAVNIVPEVTICINIIYMNKRRLSLVDRAVLDYLIRLDK